MSKHIAEWLPAYLDGELRGSQPGQVEAHLLECQACRAELEALEQLSDLLHEVPAPEFMPPEQLAARVNLRLPHQPIVVSRKRAVEIGWWMIPVGLVGTWVFISTSFWVNDLLSVANSLGWLTGLSDWLIFGPSDQAYWSATLGQFGVLSGNSLDWAAYTEAFTRTSLPQMALQVSMALLYLSWIAVWWARRQPARR